MEYTETCEYIGEILSLLEIVLKKQPNRLMKDSNF